MALVIKMTEKKRRDTRKIDLEKSTYGWKITCIYEGKQTNILKKLT